MSYSDSIAAALRTHLGDAFSQLHIRAFEEIDSTNTEAKRMAADGFDGTALITARAQSAGRGRMGRSFYSPEGTGAYFSLLYTPRYSLSDAVRITSATAVATMRAIRNLTGKQTGIKWVNDLYFCDKKVCGILAESIVSEGKIQIILGIGINLCTEDFPQEIASVAGSLDASELTPECLIAEVVKELAPYLSDAENDSWLEDYRRHSIALGRPIYWLRDGVRHDGVALEINDAGALIALRNDGTHEILSTGEITVRLQ